MHGLTNLKTASVWFRFSNITTSKQWRDLTMHRASADIINRLRFCRIRFCGCSGLPGMLMNKGA